MNDSQSATEVFLEAHNLAKQIGTFLPHGTIPNVTLVSLINDSALPMDEAREISERTTRQVHPVRGELLCLTPREEIVLERSVQHESGTGIVEELVVSSNIVKKHLTSIYRKLGVHDRTSALFEASSGIHSEVSPVDGMMRPCE